MSAAMLKRVFVLAAAAQPPLRLRFLFDGKPGRARRSGEARSTRLRFAAVWTVKVMLVAVGDEAHVLEQ